MRQMFFESVLTSSFCLLPVQMKLQTVFHINWSHGFKYTPEFAASLRRRLADVDLRSTEEFKEWWIAKVLVSFAG